MGTVETSKEQYEHTASTVSTRGAAQTRLPGGKIPRELRAYRTWALAQRFETGVRDDGFMELVRQIEGGVIHRCPPVRLLDDGEVAFREVVRGLDAATEEILVETYILRDDRIGETVQTALAAAARRGVRVYVLADAVGSLGTDDSFWTELEAQGVTLRLFHRFRHVPLQVLRRDHRKIIVIDRKVAFTGGMNIGEEYGSSITKHKDAWRDTFMRVEGSVARELASVFAEGWDRANGPTLPGLEYVSWSDDGLAPSTDASHAPRESRLLALVDRSIGRRRDRRRGRRVRRAEAVDNPSETDSAGGVLVLDSRPGRGQRETLAVMSAMVGGARQRLWVTTPYFAPPTRALTLLAGAASRGVDVRLLLPSERTDMALVRHAAHGAYTRMLRSGVRVFEYERAVLHAKTAVVDGYASIVGSSNLDFRSFWLNAECNLLIFDGACGRSLEETFEKDCSGSREITLAEWRKRGLMHRVLDRAARALRFAL
ncbi:MAG TPA: phospholipase D-like domain-containing protein [Gemmatimonas sp.]|nr:phospholipase D-like domain-containing protein [Gemmatimonas sp.]